MLARLGISYESECLFELGVYTDCIDNACGKLIQAMKMKKIPHGALLKSSDVCGHKK